MSVESQRIVMAAMLPFLSQMVSSALGGHRRAVWSGDGWLSPGAEDVSGSRRGGVGWGARRVSSKKMQDETRAVAGGLAGKVNLYLVMKETPG